MKKISQKNESKLKFYYLFAIMLVAFSQSVFSQEPLKGETKIEDAKSNAENILMGNISAGRAADKVAYEISNYDPFIKSIVIYNKEQAELFAGYDRSMTQLQELKLKYGLLLNRQKNFIDNFTRREKCTTGGRKIASDTEDINKILGEVTSGINGATAVIESAIKFLSYFRTDVILQPEVFDVDEKVMIAEVFRGLRKRFGERLTLYNPNSIPVSFNNSELIKNLDEIIEMDDEVSSNNDLIEKRLEQINCLLDKSDNENDFREMRGLKRFLEDYQRINKRFESVVSSLGGEVPLKEKDSEKIDDKNDKVKPRPNYLAAYLTVENIYRLMRKNDGGFWLEIKAVKAGGTTRIKTNLIVDVFTGGDRVSHSGASIIQYNLYNGSGFSVLSGIVPDYIPYTKPKRIIGLTEPEPERLARTKKNRENKQTADNKRNNAPGKN